MDLPCGGSLFTWSNNQEDPVMSRIDRFLVDARWCELYPNVHQFSVPRPVSDHCPIFLDSQIDSWGPSPFRFELMWLEEKGFVELVQGWWQSFQVEGWAGYRLVVKLQMLKAKLKQWSKEHFGSVSLVKDKS